MAPVGETEGYGCEITHQQHYCASLGYAGHREKYH